MSAMTVRAGRAIRLLIPILLLSACDSSIGFLGKPYADQYFEISLAARPETESPGIPIGPGSVLAPGATFDVSVDSREGGPALSLVSVSLLSSGSIAAQAIYGLEGAPEPKSPALADIPRTLVPELASRPLPVIIPTGLEEGLYTLRVEIHGEDGILFERDVLVFMFSGSLSVNSVQVCPASVAPGDFAVMRAQIEAPDGIDPYVVWTYDDEVIDSGSLSAGHADALWRTPASEGVYSLSVNAYPCAPEDGIPFDFAGTAERSVRVPVRVPAADPSNPFQADPGFFAQYRFNGSLAETGSRSPKGRPSMEGQPGVFVYGPGYGVRFDEKASLSEEGYLLPIEDGKLEPFSIMGRLMLAPEASAGGIPLELSASASGSLVAAAGAFPEPSPSTEPLDSVETPSASGDDQEPPSALPPAESPSLARTSLKSSALALFRSESTAPGFSLELGVGDDGQYLLSVSNRLEKAVFESGIFPDERIHDLVVSVVPEDGGLYVKWYWDYRDAAEAFKPIDIAAIPAGGRARFGGAGSASIVIDEFGVYSMKDGDGARLPWANAFSTLMMRTMRRSFVYAEGFDGSLPADISYRGDANVDRGVCILGKESALSIPLPEKFKGSIDVEVAFRVMEDSLKNRDFSLVLGVGEDEAIRIRQDGRYSLPEKADGEIPSLVQGKSIKLSLGSDARGYFVSGGDARIRLPVQAGLGLGLWIETGNAILPIESVLIGSSDDDKLKSNTSL